MKTGKQSAVNDISVLYRIFGKLDVDTDIIVESSYCSHALLNETIGEYGCRMLEGLCPYDMPDPKRCRTSGNFKAHRRADVYPLNLRG
jgi:hypothetical protein